MLATAPAAVQEALLFRQWSHNVTLFQHTMPAPSTEEIEQLKARSVKIIEGQVQSLQIVDDTLTGVALASGQIIPCEALVVSPGSRIGSTLIQSLGLQARNLEDGAGQHLDTDPSGLTAVPGVWAAGNVTDPAAQLVTAASAGVKAATAINADLVAEETRQAVTAAKQDNQS